MRTLSPRQRELLPLLAAGLTYVQIARQLHISIGTVKGHCTKLYRKLGANCAAHAVAIALRDGLIEMPVEDTSPIVLLHS